jgi:hypothetical protein
LEPLEWARFRDGIEAFAKSHDPELDYIIRTVPRLTSEVERRLTAVIHGFIGTGR